MTIQDWCKILTPKFIGYVNEIDWLKFCDWYEEYGEYYELVKHLRYLLPYFIDDTQGIYLYLQDLYWLPKTQIEKKNTKHWFKKEIWLKIINKLDYSIYLYIKDLQ